LNKEKGRQVGMGNRIVVLLALFLLVLDLIPVFVSFNVNVILISWDGVQRNHLYELLHEGKLGNLSNLIDVGVIKNLSISDHFTDTKPGHAQMLTGYSPLIMKVWSNILWEPVPDGLTIFERLKVRYGSNIANLMVASKSKNVGGRVYVNSLAEIDKFTVVNEDADYVGAIMLSYLELYANKWFFAFFHFRDPDEAGHNCGENSLEYEEAIILLDVWLGRILNKLSELNIISRTVVYVTTDHGFDEGEILHAESPEIWLVCNVSSYLQEIWYQRQIALTILKAFGIDIDALYPSYKQPEIYLYHLMGYCHSPYSREIKQYPVMARPDENVDFNWGVGSPSPEVGDDNFTVTWRGHIYIPISGNYTFRISLVDEVNDEANLRLDGLLVAYKNGSWTGFLSRGFHSIIVWYWDRTGSSGITLYWRPVGGVEEEVLPRAQLYVEIPLS